MFAGKDRRSWDSLAMAVCAAGGLAAAGVALWCWFDETDLGVPRSSSNRHDPVAKAAPMYPSPLVRARPGKGEHTLRGVVVDLTGAPVALAVLTAELEPGEGVRSAAVPNAGGGSRDVDAAVIAVSDSDGNFALRGLLAGRHRVRVEGNGIVPAETRFLDVPGDELRLVVARSTKVIGTVLERGRPKGGATVWLFGGTLVAPRETHSDDRGAFVFPDTVEGRYRVWAAAGGAVAPAIEVMCLGGGPHQPVMLALEPGAALSGRVLDAQTGIGVAARVRLIAEQPLEAERNAQSDATGAFRIEAVPPGRWTAEAVAPGYVPADPVGLAVGSGSAATLHLTRGGVVAGHVVDGTGAPVVGATLSLLGEAEEGGRVELDQIALWRALGETGRIIAATRTGGLSPGQRFLESGELGVLLGPIPYPPPSAAPRVRVTIPLAGSPSPIDTLPELPVAPDLEPRFVSDGNGSFRITGLPAGTYKVRARHPDFAEGISAPLSIELGQEREVRVVIAPGLSVIGRVLDPRGVPTPGAAVTAELASGESRHAVSGPDGYYRLGPFAMSVSLRASAAGFADAEKEVSIARLGNLPVERTVDLELGAADAQLTGIIEDVTGAMVAGARLRFLPIGRRGVGGSTRSGDDGVFTLKRVARGRYRAQVSHQDYPATTVEVSTETPARIRLALGGGISGVVRDTYTGVAIAGAAVEAEGPTGSEQIASSSHGVVRLFPLAAGTWQVRVRRAGYAPFESKVVVPRAERAGELTVTDYRFELERGAALAGVVRDESGLVSGAAVRVRSVTTRTDAKGRFRLEDVPTGAVQLEANKGKEKGSIPLDLAAGDEFVTLEISIGR
jgi:hypothetical protein